MTGHMSGVEWRAGVLLSNQESFTSKWLVQGWCGNQSAQRKPLTLAFGRNWSVISLISLEWNPCVPLKQHKSEILLTFLHCNSIFRLFFAMTIEILFKGGVIPNGNWNYILTYQLRYTQLKSDNIMENFCSCVIK